VKDAEGDVFNLSPKERHLCCFAWVFWRYIMSAVYLGVWLCSHFLLWLFFTKTQWRPFLFPLFSWQVQEYLLPWRSPIVTLGCVACWSLVFLQHKPHYIFSVTRRTVKPEVLSGMLFMMHE